MSGTSRSVLLERPGHSELVEGPLPRPGPGEVLVAVGAAGLCGSDVELYDGRRPEGYRRYPVVPGHEWAGTVAEVGESVSQVRAGDRVVAEGIRWCGACARCREGATNLCLAPYAETGFTHPGAFSDHVVVPARLVHALPSGADLEEAALLEPAACVAAGVLVSPPQAGARVAIIGAGTLGLLAVCLLRLHSPAELTVVDPRQDRRELALALGATAAVAPPPPAGLEADLVVETAGVGETLPLALGAARRGGAVVALGIAGVGSVPIDPDVFAVRSLEVRGVFSAPTRAWQHVVGLFAAGLLPLRELISHRLGLDGYEDALELVGRPGTGKVLLIPSLANGHA
jgi:2-desacetyl-2-hydroxyethyl bacteriochlorophyllide A dehydrogenase